MKSHESPPQKPLKHCGVLCVVPCSRHKRFLPRNNQSRPALNNFCLLRGPPKRKLGRELLYLSGGDGLAETGTALSRAEVLVTLGDGIGLLDDLISLGEDELDVAGVGHVGVDLSWVSI